MNLKLFFSHAWADKAGAKVKKLMLLLQKHYDVWLDKKQIDLGAHINDTVAEGIAQCDIFICVWSRNAHDSKGVLFELETAARLNKPTLVLKIDDFDTANSPLLAGKEYVDFSGDTVSFNQQEPYLHNFLLRKKTALFGEHFTAPGEKETLEEIRNKTGAVQEVLIELEDTMKRQKMQASGNDDSDVYIQSSLNAFEKTLDPREEAGRVMLLFSQKMKEISEKFPLQKDDRIKKEMAIKAIEEIDPGATNNDLAELKAAFEHDLGLIKAEPVEPAKTEEPADKMLAAFSKVMREIADKYPLKSDDKIKKRLALKAIKIIDPDGTHENINAFRVMFEEDLGMRQKSAPKTGKTMQRVISPEQELVKAYKESVARTREQVLQKARTAFDGIPILNIFSSVNTASADFEMSYITNSPAILEKLYQAALLTQDKELRSVVEILIRHINLPELQKAEATGKIKSYMPYAYLINNTARLLVQAKAVNEADISYSLVSSMGLDKLSKFFFQEDWKEKAEKFLDMVKTNYGIKDKNLNWIKGAAAVVGVVLLADGLADMGDGTGGVEADAALPVDGGSPGAPVYFEDKMASMGFSMPNTVQY